MGVNKFTLKSEIRGHLNREMDMFFQGKTWNFAISKISCKFPKILGTVPHKIITSNMAFIGFDENWSRKCLRVRKNLQRMSSILIRLELYHENAIKFAVSTCDAMKHETRSSQSSGCTDIHQKGRKIC
jgi:hypothetical protein